MDLLTQRGEMTAADLAEIQALTKDELVALVVRLNRGWYQLLEELEDAHRDDLKTLEEELTKHCDTALANTRASEQMQLDGFRAELTKSESRFVELKKNEKENAKRLDSVKSVLEKLTKNS